MQTTSISLLERLRQPADSPAWQRFVDLYTPMLFQWARRKGMQEQDASDLVQDVLTTLVQKLPEFQYDPSRSFRRWLMTLALNRWRDRCRRQAVRAPEGVAPLSDLEAPDELGEFEEAEYRQHLVARALRIMQADFQPATWQACWEHVVQRRPAAEVAAQLGISESAVYVAKFRVLNRLRQELAGLLE